MNILLPYSLILEYLDTDVTVEEFQKYLSLSGPSVERVTKTEDGDYVLDIEVTSNRVDTASLVGIIQEAAAILPRFGKKANVRKDLLSSYHFKNHDYRNVPMLSLEIDYTLCSRFVAVVLEQVHIKQSPEHIRLVLEKAGIRVINNVVDITNYLTILFGQPSHAFDFDKLKGAKMKLRLSQKGEVIDLLDEKKYILPGSDMVIEDGEGRLIDLCGIMGGKLSEIDETTKRVVFFVQTYDKTHIRKTSMQTGARSEAASLFEKGLDSERVEPTFSYGLSLLKDNADAVIASSLIDENRNAYTPRSIQVHEGYFSRRLGVELKQENAVAILNSLGFQTKVKDRELFVTVPFWRQYDVYDEQDLFEEVARLYGYHRIPDELSPFVLITDEKIRQAEKIFLVEDKIKNYLMNVGFTEMYNYSMISEKTHEMFWPNTMQSVLKIANPLSDQLIVMRKALIPSLLSNAVTNIQYEDLCIFEIANIYESRENNLPNEKKKLAFLTKCTFLESKGVVENLGDLLNIPLKFHREKTAPASYVGSAHVGIYVDDELIGYCAELSAMSKYQLDLKGEYSFVEIDMEQLIAAFNPIRSFPTISKIPFVIEDVTYVSTPDTSWDVVTSKLSKEFPNLKKISLESTYENAVTMRLYTLPEKGASLLPAILKYLEEELKLHIKK